MGALMWRGVGSVTETPVVTFFLGRQSDRVWVSCHQICMTLAQPITSAGITSLGEK